MRQILGLTWPAAVFLFMSCVGDLPPEWGLPVKLGQSSAEVRQVLGIPNDVLSPEAVRDRYPDLSEHLQRTSPTVSTEYYNSSGIFGIYDGGRLLGITLPPHADYKGFLPYVGTIVNGVKLTDTKQEILHKLGEPTKVEHDPLESGVDPNVPVVWPAESRYYWRKTGYTLQIDFLRQAQLISEKQALTSPKDAVSVIRVYK